MRSLNVPRLEPKQLFRVKLGPVALKPDGAVVDRQERSGLLMRELELCYLSVVWKVGGDAPLRALLVQPTSHRNRTLLGLRPGGIDHDAEVVLCLFKPLKEARRHAVVNGAI